MKIFTLGGEGGQKNFRGPQGGQGPRLQKFEKKVIQNGCPNLTQSFSIPAQLESVYKSGELKCEEKERKKDILDLIWRFSKSHKNFNVGHFGTQIFAIRSCVPTEPIEVLKINLYGWEQCKNKMMKITNSTVGYIALLRQLASVCKG